MQRKLLGLFLLVSLLAVSCSSLRGPAGAPYEIIVNTPYPAREAFNRIGRELDRRGYFFEEIDRQFGALRTEQRRINDSVHVQIAVDVLGTNPAELRLWGWYRTDEGSFRIQQEEQPGTATYDAWQELKEIAEWVPGYITYP